MSIELRPYQKECIKTVDELPDGSKTIVCLATGMGKTLTAANFHSKGRILWLSHRDELVRQPERYFKAIGKSYGIEKAGETAGDEMVVSASVQSLSRDKRLHKYKPTDFDIVICDEAQHAAAPTYKKILGYFKPRKLIGLTATPKRGDGVKLSDVFDDICFTRDLKWGIKNGYLSRIRALRVTAAIDFKKIKTSMGDLMASSISEVMLKSDDDIVVARAYMDHCLPEHKKTLIYCPTINICTTIYKTMTEVLPDEEKAKVAVLSERNSPEERKNILESYKEKDGINCIINCMILTEGTDLPETSVIINNRPTANASLYQQIIGRGTRLYPGKDYCLVIDIVGENCAERNICTAPTLFGLDAEKLPETVRNELEKGDLLELTEDILEQRAKAVISIMLKKEMIDIFTGQRIKVIEDNKKDGYKSIAKEYEKMLTAADNDDFGDIMFKLQPEEEKYYCVPATYNGNIYISKPDMLDKCIVTIDIPADETPVGKKWYGRSNIMPFATAIDIVKDILKYSIDSKYILKWSRSARKSLNKAEASQKQMEYIDSLYKTDNIPITNERLSKLQASDLIELRREIEQFRNAKRKIEIDELKPQTETTNAQDLNENYKRIVLYTVTRRQDKLKQAAEFAKNNSTGSVKVKIDNKELARYNMSAKQRAFINNLNDTLSSQRKTPDVPPMSMNLNMYEASMMIGCYREFTKMSEIPEGMSCTLYIKEFIDSLNTITDDYAECKYSISSFGIPMELYTDGI